MSHRSSHTHCQVAQADTQAKTWQRVCLPHPKKIELKKFSFPSENKKYATAQPHDRQKSVAMQTPKPLTTFFEFETLNLLQLLICITIGFISVIWYEIVKLIKRTKANNDRKASL